MNHGTLLFCLKLPFFVIDSDGVSFGSTNAQYATYGIKSGIRVRIPRQYCLPEAECEQKVPIDVMASLQVEIAHSCVAPVTDAGAFTARR